MTIRYLKHKEINRQKWEACLRQMPPAMIYANSSYLDLLTDGQWDALVMGDYTAVMPLTFRKKWGIRYLYQPAFVQQGGIWGAYDEGIRVRFLKEAKHYFSFAEINLNYSNRSTDLPQRSNQILSLAQPYDAISKSYTDYTNRKLRQSAAFDLTYQAIDPEVNLQAYQKLFGPRTPNVTKTAYQQLLQFCRQYPEMTCSRAIKIQQEIVASVIGMIYNHRICLLTLTAHDRQTYSFANHVLIDQLIREFAGMEMTLDFEGSDLPGVHSFNKGFGASDQPYSFCKWNQLPWPLRLLKR